MRNLTECVIITAAVAFAFVGGVYGEKAIAQENAERAWSEVMVTRGATLVANPSALTPKELASATIINPRDYVTVCEDRAGNVFVNPVADECVEFKEMRRF